METARNLVTKIVLIEDNDDDQQLLKGLLEEVPRQSFDLHCCENMHDGMSAILQYKPDVVLLDLSLPDSFGIETVKNVQKKFPFLPIIVLTGNDDDTLALQAIEAGAQDYLTKGTISWVLLSRTINYSIERQRMSLASKWSAALIANPSYAFVGQSLDGIILTWNIGAQCLFGFDAAEMIGSPIHKLLPTNEAAPINPLSFNDISLSSKTPLPKEAWLVTKDGRNMLVEIYYSPVIDLDNEITAFSLLMRDVTKERQTENELKEKNQRLNFAAASAKLGLWDWDPTNREFRFGDGMFELFELPRAKSSPTFNQFLDMVHPVDRILVKSILKKRGVFNFDFRIVLTNQIIRIVQMKGETFTDTSGTPTRIAGVCLDITERKLVEEALKISEETLFQALDASQMGVWEFSLEDKVTSRSMLHDGIFGATNERLQWTPKIFMEHVHQDDYAFVKSALNDSLITGKMNLECRIINRDDGSTRWISLQAKQSLNSLGKTRFIGTIRDLTQSKTLQMLADQAHERSAQILHAVVEHAPTGIAVLDAQMKVSSVNHSFLQLTQQSAGLMIGKKLTHVMPNLAIKKACSTVEKGQPAEICRLSAPTQLGEEKFFDFTIWPIKIDGKVSGAVLLMSDSTHTVLLERQRDDFVASVAHDIKNPLLGTSRLLEILCNEAVQAPFGRQEVYLNALKDSTHNLLSLVQNLVDVYRYETLVYPCHFEKISSAVLFDSCVQQMSIFAESKNVQISSCIKAGAEAFDADTVGIRRVLMNLLHNAIKFNNPFGEVKLSIRKEKNKVIITVTDTGYGINESEKKTLFQKFSQGIHGKNTSVGTGIGLYLSKQIVSAHGGTISCDSDVTGTVFSIELPMRQRSVVKTIGPSALKT